MAEPDQRPPANHRRPATALRGQVAVRRAIADQVISLAHPGDVAPTLDVLDSQLVDVAGVQVVPAANVYPVNVPNGWRLAGVEVSLPSFVRRLPLKSRVRTRLTTPFVRPMST